MVHLVDSTGEGDMEATDSQGRAASFEEWWAIPPEYRAEYVGGRIFMNRPSYRHQKVCQQLHDEVHRQHPLAITALSVGWRMFPDRQDYRIPDLMILDREPEEDVVTLPPLVAVEVLSQNRSTDLVRKAHEYLEAGAGQYWLVDPRDRTIEALLATDSGWQPLARLDDDNPGGVVTVEGLGEVRLDLRTVLG
jgi:Uma2 family endonuclease